MGVSLIPCPSCDRHVRASESACPFCKGALPECAPGTARRPAGRALSRAAILFAGATAVAGCSSTSPGNDAATDTVNVDTQPDLVALYGPAPVDVQSDDAVDVQSQPEVGVLYGPAPVDSGNNG